MTSKTPRKGASQVLQQWEGYLNKGDLENILTLYASDAVLWGTFSKAIRDNSDLIHEYFQELLQKENLRVNFGTVRHRVYKDVHLFSGTYEFSHGREEPIVLPARFTLVIHRVEGGDYKIVEHHSSLIPNRVTPTGNPGLS